MKISHVTVLEYCNLRVWNLLQLEGFEICEGSEFAETKDERNESPNCHKYRQHGRAVILGVGVSYPWPTRFPPGWSWLLEYDLITALVTTVVSCASNPGIIWTIKCMRSGCTFDHSPWSLWITVTSVSTTNHLTSLLKLIDPTIHLLIIRNLVWFLLYW